MEAGRLTTEIQFFLHSFKSSHVVKSIPHSVAELHYSLSFLSDANLQQIIWMFVSRLLSSHSLMMPVYNTCSHDINICGQETKKIFASLPSFSNPISLSHPRTIVDYLNTCCGLTFFLVAICNRTHRSSASTFLASTHVFILVPNSSRQFLVTCRPFQTRKLVD